MRIKHQSTLQIFLRRCMSGTAANNHHVHRVVLPWFYYSFWNRTLGGFVLNIQCKIQKKKYRKNQRDSRHSGVDEENTTAWFIAGSTRSSGPAFAAASAPQNGAARQQTFDESDAAAVRIFVNGNALRDASRWAIIDSSYQISNYVCILLTSKDVAYPHIDYSNISMSIPTFLREIPVSSSRANPI